MAERRMFAKTIIDSDAFIDMPSTARLLYYDLSMRADDDGFVNSPKKIIRMTGASEDDLSILILRKFILPFDNGVVVIKHWRIHNYIRKDTYNETPYTEQKNLLELDENKAYRFKDNMLSRQLVDGKSTQVRIGKDSIDKDNKKERKKNNYDLIIDEFVSDPDVKTALLEFIKMRKLIKAPLTDQALKNIINKLFKLSSDKEEQILILNESIDNNWKGVFPLKNSKQVNKIPDWFAKNNTIEKITPAEEEELDSILNEISN